MSTSSTFTGLTVLVWYSSSFFIGIDTQLCVDSNPPTGLTVLDNWVFGFGWIRWVSLLLPATSESKSFSFCTTSESKTRLKSDRNCTSLSASASLKNMLRARELHVASAKVNTGHTWRQLMKSLQQSVRWSSAFDPGPASLTVCILTVENTRLRLSQTSANVPQHALLRSIRPRNKQTVPTHDTPSAIQTKKQATQQARRTSCHHVTPQTRAHFLKETLDVWPASKGFSPSHERVQVPTSRADLRIQQHNLYGLRTKHDVLNGEACTWKGKRIPRRKN